MVEAVQQKPNEASPVKPGRVRLWGRFTAFGFLVAMLAAAVDQLVKVWLVSDFDLASRGYVHVLPLIDFVLTWNTGISYGLFQQQGTVGEWALLAFKAAAVIFLWLWLARVQSRLTAAALGLIIGGAVGNAIDRLHWPGVMDFVLFHIETTGFTFRWYVFNIADVAIVAGVVGLLYESLWRGGAVKAP